MRDDHECKGMARWREIQRRGKYVQRGSDGAENLEAIVVDLIKVEIGSKSRTLWGIKKAYERDQHDLLVEARRSRVT